MNPTPATVQRDSSCDLQAKWIFRITGAVQFLYCHQFDRTPRSQARGGVDHE